MFPDCNVRLWRHKCIFTPNAICALLHSIASLHSLSMGCSVLSPACPLAAFHVLTSPRYTCRERLCLVQLRTPGRGAWHPGHTFQAERFTTWNWLNSLPIKWLDSLLCWESCITDDAREGRCERIEQVLIQRPGLLDIPTGKSILI